MPISVSNQVYVFLFSVMGGAAIALLYDAFRIKRKTFRTPAIIVHIEDFLYWLLVALVMFGTVYYSNDGELRGYIFIGTAMGAALYILLFSRLIMKSSLLIINFIKIVVTAIIKIVLFPLKVLYRIFSIPARIISRLTGKGVKRLRNAGRARLTKAKLWRKVFRNARKKI